ncbi:MAG: hypothetical protein HQL34_08565 [Alphaproteobacteria bacterium]|nr:hypothetical protein [Alphaproteobacteria bacterium]
MSIVLGAGAWGLVIFGVIATAAVYDYLVREDRLDVSANGSGQKAPQGALRSAVRAAFPAE